MGGSGKVSLSLSPPHSAAALFSHQSIRRIQRWRTLTATSRSRSRARRVARRSAMLGSRRLRAPCGGTNWKQHLATLLLPCSERFDRSARARRRESSRSEYMLRRSCKASRVDVSCAQCCRNFYCSWRIVERSGRRSSKAARHCRCSRGCDARSRPATYGRDVRCVRAPSRRRRAWVVVARCLLSAVLWFRKRRWQWRRGIRWWRRRRRVAARRCLV